MCTFDLLHICYTFHVSVRTARIANERERRHGRLIIEVLTILCYVDLLVTKMAERTERYRSIRQPV